MHASRTDSAWTYFIALALLLAAPLSAFLIANQYPVLSAEVGVLVAACLGAAAALGIAVRFGGRAAAPLVLGAAAALCIDLLYGLGSSTSLLVLVPALCMAVAWLLREHVALILSVTSAVLLVSIHVLPSDDAVGSPEPTVSAQERSPVDKSKLPVILHLVLDEHIGIAGLPHELAETGDLARSLTDFYVRRGFRLFPRAYSEYFDTLDSIPNLLNFTSRERAAAHLAEGKSEPLVLKENAYFRHLSQLGYRHHVYQSDYMDFCRAADVVYATCVAYSAHRLGSVHGTDLAAVERAEFIFDALLGTSSYWKSMELHYGRMRGAALWLPLPEWRHGDARVGPIPVLPIFERLERDLRSASRGSVFFAHLLVPHYPYVLDESCRVRAQTEDWLNRSEGRDAVVQNTDATRKQRYLAYYAQIGCQQKLLLALFNAMKQAGVWDDAVVVIHGDHGSRIVRRLPDLENADRMTPEDYRDAFSTLFAVRNGGGPGAVLDDVRSLQYLLGDAFGMPTADAPPRVFLRAHAPRGLAAHALEGF